MLADLEHSKSKFPRPSFLENWLPVIIGVVGLWMAYHPMFLSGFGKIAGDSGDSRLINYLLEHSYRWVRSDPIHGVFWDPPFYYPARNVVAHSDLLVGSAPPYWACRALGASPDTAFQLWMVVVSALNFACGYLLFRGGLQCGKPASTAAAFLVAFGAPRLNQQVHHQLISCLYISITIYSLVRVFSEEDPEPGPARRLALWLVAALSTAGQLYTGFYQGWFLIWSTGLAILAALILPSCRGIFLRVVKRDAWAILAASIVGWLVLRPLVTHYRQADVELHQGYYPMIPTFWSWLNTGPDSWFWGWTADFEAFRALPSGIEDRLGFGFLTPLVCLVGLYLGRNQVACRLSAFVLLGWFACIAQFPVSGDDVAVVAWLVAAIGLALVFRDRDEPRPRVLTAVGLLTFLALDRFPNGLMLALGQVAIGVVVAEIVRSRHEARRPVAPWLILAGLFVLLYHPYLLAMALLMVVPIWVISERMFTGRPGTVAARPAALRPAAALAMSAILAVIAYPDQPWLAVTWLTGPLLIRAVGTIPERLRPRPWTSAWVVLVALLATVYCYHTGSLWESISRDIPGGTAIRGVGRVILFMLIPLGVGLAASLGAIEARWGKALAWSVGILCLLEQGMTAPTYDKQAERDRVAAIAARIDPECEAFYYHTRRDGSWIAYVDYQLDAMWASLERGKPTINGYTSVWPRDWIELRLCAFLPDPEVRDALHDWARSRNLDLHRIEWINEDGGPVRFSPFFGSKPGDSPVPGESRKKNDDPSIVSSE